MNYIPERISSKQLIAYIHTNNLFDPFQIDFHSNSAETALVRICDNCIYYYLP